MGCLYEFNWILKLSDINSDAISSGKRYCFVKKGIRIYPINVPIDLVNENWEAIASCIISNITITCESTNGEYEILEIYDENKKRILSEQWRGVLKHSIGKNQIDDYSKMHIT